MLKKIKILTVVFIVSALFMSSCVVIKPQGELDGKKEDTADVIAADDGKKEATAKDADDASEGENADGETDSAEENKEAVTDDKKDDSKNKDALGEEELISADRWKIKPNYVYDFIETFGKTKYSIYKQGDTYGVMDIDGYYIGEETYSELVYCPTHGLSSKDVTGEPVVLCEDLEISPDCGYRKSAGSEVIYVFDSTRDRVYATGYSDGAFKIADITDTEFFTQNDRYTVVLYDCDADIMMYEGIGMNSLSEVFKAENLEMRYGVIDLDMDYIVACIYDEVLDGNDCYIVKKDGKYGYLGLTGKEYYPCVFEKANTAYDGRAWVKLYGKWGTVKF